MCGTHNKFVLFSNIVDKLQNSLLYGAHLDFTKAGELCEENLFCISPSTRCSTRV